MLSRIAAVDVVTAAAVAAGVLFGGWWWAVSAAVWLVAFSGAVVTLPGGGIRSRAAPSAVLAAATGIPLCAALAVLATRRSSLEAGVAVAGLTVAGLAGGWTMLLPVGARVHRGRPVARPARRRRLLPAGVVGVGATVAAGVPVGADSLLVARMAEKVARCPSMQRFAGRDAPLGLRRELAAACALQTGGGPGTRSEGGGLAVTVFQARPDLDPRAVELAGSALSHHRELLGPPAPTAVSVLPVPLSGSVRGMAGPGFVLVHPSELAAPDRCATFRRTAGVEGRCGAWVLAHELAHQWFRWTSYERASQALPVLVEGTADYMAYSWWRATYGAADAGRLALELFDGRLALARAFATTHAPVAPPTGMTDAQGRALVYGRPSAAWVAVEHAVGVAATREALRAVHQAGRGSNPTIDGVLDAVAAAVPAAAPVLAQWWRDTSFEPRLPPT